LLLTSASQRISILPFWAFPPYKLAAPSGAAFFLPDRQPASSSPAGFALACADRPKQGKVFTMMTVGT
jgi:hypothetical protein